MATPPAAARSVLEVCIRLAPELTTAANELVQAVAERSLTAKEEGELGLFGLNFAAPSLQHRAQHSVLTAIEEGELELPVSNSLRHRSQRAALNLTADKALENFYQVFEKRASQLGINKNSVEYGRFFTSAQQMIRNAGDEKSKAEPSDENQRARSCFLRIKIETAVKELNKKIFAGMINACADKPLDQITIDDFKQTVAMIEMFFPEIPDVELVLRHAIIAKLGVIEFVRIITEFSNPTANAAKLFVKKAEIETALKAQRDAKEARRKELCGPNGFDGQIDDAFRRRERAKQELNLALDALLAEMSFNGLLKDGNIVALLAVSTNNPYVEAKKADLEAKVEAFGAASKDFDKLVAELHTIVQYRQNSNDIVGGDLFALDQQLTDAELTNEARRQITRTAGFYAEFLPVINQLRNANPAYDIALKDQFKHDVKAEHGLLRDKEKKIKDQLRALRGHSDGKAQAAWEALINAKKALGQDPANDVSKWQAFNAAEAAYKPIDEASRTLFKELATVQRRMREIENTLATPAKVELAFWRMMEKIAALR
jgi:hypothetical protein